METQDLGEHKSKIIFLGTGTSEGIPRVSCLLKKECLVCCDAVKPGSKNRRRNTSIMIQYYNKETKEYKNIMIDCGKFFFHSAIEWFPKFDIQSTDSIILTHDHLDACGGLDDLRDITRHMGHSIPIYLRQKDLDILTKTQYYIVNTSKATGSKDVPSLKFHTIDSKKEFIVDGLSFTPLEVMHGSNYTCLGFKFGGIVYLSDVSSIPSDVRKIIQNCDLLILDCVERGSHPSHLTWEGSIAEIKSLKPKKTFLIGMAHEFDHEATNLELKQYLSQGLNIELSFDGMCIEDDL